MYVVCYYFVYFISTMSLWPSWPHISISSVFLCGSLYQISHSVDQNLENFVVSIIVLCLKCGELQVTSTFTC